jgi:hypothetical protein
LGKRKELLRVTSFLLTLHRGNCNRPLFPPAFSLSSWFFLLPAGRAIQPDLLLGIEAAWHPVMVLFLQVLWGIVFVWFGKSMVAGAEISFHLHQDRI